MKCQKSLVTLLVRLVGCQNTRAHVPHGENLLVRQPEEKSS